MAHNATMGWGGQKTCPQSCRSKWLCQDLNPAFHRAPCSKHQATLPLRSYHFAKEIFQHLLCLSADLLCLDQTLRKLYQEPALIHLAPPPIMLGPNCEVPTPFTPSPSLAWNIFPSALADNCGVLSQTGLGLYPTTALGLTWGL